MNIDVSCAKCNKPGDATVNQLTVPKYSTLGTEVVYTFAPPDGWIGLSVFRTNGMTVRFVCPDCRKNTAL